MISKISFVRWLKNYYKEALQHKYPEYIIDADLLKKIKEFEDYVRYSERSVIEEERTRIR